jgi:hypothetical protein
MVRVEEQAAVAGLDHLGAADGEQRQEQQASHAILLQG